VTKEIKHKIDARSNSYGNISKNTVFSFIARL
jgi:hypothetical protein